jgi:hypothetical protein
MADCIIIVCDLPLLKENFIYTFIHHRHELCNYDELKSINGGDPDSDYIGSGSFCGDIDRSRSFGSSRCDKLESKL